MLNFLAMGRWRPGQVSCRWSESSFRPTPAVAALIEQRWQEEQHRPEIHLFDGQMCRLEGYEVLADSLALALSPTSYKAFFGTNLTNPGIAEVHGPGALANPLGVSCALVSGDGFLMMGRRNQRVAYYPGRVHPFAGALEPRDGMDVFAGMFRELDEELKLKPEQLDDPVCLGLVEDRALRQPELIFMAHTSLPRKQIELQRDPVEHRDCCGIATTAHALEASLSQMDELTPVGVATVLLAGRQALGAVWFDSTRARARLGKC